MDVSPRNFYGSTLGDELFLAQGQKSKTIALATKGRGAILMGGRLAKTYWMNDDTGEMTTSTYYAKALPAWVETWNKKKLADSYFGKTWDRLLPATVYIGSDDDVASEANTKGFGKTFPHKMDGKLKEPGPAYYDVFCMTPFASDWELDFAKTAVENEQLGQRGVTDLLAISISAPDLAGHDFGPMSHEVQDIVVRTDKQIGDFLDWTYGKLGKDEVLVVVSADHGGVAIPEQMSALGFSAGRIKKAALKDAVEKAIKDKLGLEKSVLALEDPHIFLDRKKIEEKKLDLEKVEKGRGRGRCHDRRRRRLLHQKPAAQGRCAGHRAGALHLADVFRPAGRRRRAVDAALLFLGQIRRAGRGHDPRHLLPVRHRRSGAHRGRRGEAGHIRCSRDDRSGTHARALLGVARPAGAEGRVIPLGRD